MSVYNNEAVIGCGYAIKHADVAQEVEHILGKDEVSGSSPDISSTTSMYLQNRYVGVFL